ncbi:MAG TPA: hypothetical protein VEI02_14015 [Planctomycetota bacterium]|nr:hypothetical protein [Planctomycetota bacterium]
MTLAHDSAPAADERGPGDGARARGRAPRKTGAQRHQDALGGAFGAVPDESADEPSDPRATMAPWADVAAPAAPNPTMASAALQRPVDRDLPGLAAGLVVASISQIERMIADAVGRAVREALAEIRPVGAPPETPEKLLDAAACAEIAGVDMRTWRRLVNAGVTPPCLRLSNKIRRWSRRAIEDWARSGGAATPAVILRSEARPALRRRRSAFDQARKEGA